MNPIATVSQPAEVATAPRGRLRGQFRGLFLGRAVRALLAVGVTVGVAAWLVPRVVGTTLHDVAAAVGTVSGREFVVLTLLWAIGLVTHSFVLTGALPGLSRRRALTLNLTGSAVSNVMPFGGAFGMTLNYTMLRAWRMSPTEFASYTLVTNVWVVLLKLALPGVALSVLVVTGVTVAHGLGLAAAIAVVLLGALVLATLTGLASRRRAEQLAGFVGRVTHRVGSRVRRPVPAHVVAARVVACRDEVVGVVRDRWLQLSAGMTGYALCQATLLWACLHVVGAPVGVTVVLAAYAVERLFSLVVVTPGAVGLTEAGAAATLVALGGPPAAVAAGVLLYRGYIMALEVPVGGAWLGGWLLARRLRARKGGDR